MIRRRRRRRDIAFSFDSFLDVVANVCGIIIRLILVVWVGARSYSALKDLPAPQNEPAVVAEAAEDEPPVPPNPELDEERRRLAEAEAALLRQLRELEQVQQEEEKQRGRLAPLEQRRQRLVTEREALARAADDEKRGVERALPSVEQLRERSRRLTEEVLALEKLPPVRRQLRYRTPVSKPVDAEELMFECRRGRVAFIDVAAMLEDVKRGLREKSEALKRTWEVEDVAGPVGAFRLRYTVERVRDGLGGAQPDPNASFSYGLSSWRVEPVTEARGETLEEARKAGSEFRQIVDGLDPQHAAVTFWVYPDSFGLYRSLRDYLYERDLVVAGRPLPDGVPIASSRNGTTSRGQ
jgi:hypothetical protein